MKHSNKYITFLYQKAVHCNFDKLEETIRDQVIKKCLANWLRIKLIGRGHDLTLDQLHTIACTMKLSNQQAQQMKMPSAYAHPESVNRVYHGTMPKDRYMYSTHKTPNRRN